jgi:hypothetical protein
MNEPSDKQLELCYRILERTKEAPADEHAQPLFELTADNAEAYIDAFVEKALNQELPIILDEGEENEISLTLKDNELKVEVLEDGEPISFSVLSAGYLSDTTH